jgi:hypothetical protein
MEEMWNFSNDVMNNLYFDILSLLFIKSDVTWHRSFLLPEKK